MARKTATGMADYMLDDRTRDVADTIALVKGYIRLTELQIELGMTEDEAWKDAAERLTADEVLGAVGAPPDETDPDSL